MGRRGEWQQRESGAKRHRGQQERFVHESAEPARKL
jgi:hypothetical protein